MNISGFFQRLLHIDLGSQSFEIRSLHPELLGKTLGGKGLAAHLFAQEVREAIDPLSAANPLIVALGPATDTPIWGSARFGVFTKSPLTGCFNESYAGGRAAFFISRTGFDALMITGISDAPVWLQITSNGPVFHPATDVWGRDCHQSEAALKARCASNCGALVIGPAGENLVRFAVVATDKWHMLGRGGTGAVMGSKRLKGIVFHGALKRPVHAPQALRSWSRSLLQTHKDQPGPQNYRTFGTTAMWDLMNTAGALPSSYWSTGRIRNWEALSATSIKDCLQPTARSCPRCFLACRKLCQVQSGPHQGLRLEGPEYETLYALGGLCLIQNIQDIVYLNDLCDRLGMDTISAGNLAGLVMEGTRQGHIQQGLTYGNPDQVAQIFWDMAQRKGLGGILALGIDRAARHLGLEDLAVHVKGMEPAGYDPRVLKGMGLAYAVSSRGACHLRASFHRAELTGEADPEDPAGLVGSFKEHEDVCTVMDSLIICRFFRKIYAQKFPEMVRLCTGLDLDMPALQQKAGEIMDQTRRINLEQGVSADDDRLPRRLTRQVLPDGSSISREDIEIMVGEYYRQRGWDEHGVPLGMRALSSPSSLQT